MFLRFLALVLMLLNAISFAGAMNNNKELIDRISLAQQSYFAIFDIAQDSKKYDNATRLYTIAVDQIVCILNELENIVKTKKTVVSDKDMDSDRVCSFVCNYQLFLDELWEISKQGSVGKKFHEKYPHDSSRCLCFFNEQVRRLNHDIQAQLGL